MSNAFCVLSIIGCEGSTVLNLPTKDAQFAPVVDAAEIDVCSCEHFGNLSDKIEYMSTQLEMLGARGLGEACLDENLVWQGALVGGSLTLLGVNEHKTSIGNLGTHLPDVVMLGEPENRASWLGTMTTSESDPQRKFLTTTVACIDPLIENDSGCGRHFQVSHDVTYVGIPPGEILDETARCTQGMLVGGSCSVAHSQDEDVHVLRSGIDPQDPSRWLCSWRSQLENDEIVGFVQSFCLEEVIPEACGCCTPATDSIIVRKEIRPLKAGTNRLQVSCEPGESLLLGNCMLDGVDLADMTNITMFRFGFPPGTRNAWGCSWNNPDAVNAQAIASALCVPE